MKYSPFIKYICCNIKNHENETKTNRKHVKKEVISESNYAILEKMQINPDMLKCREVFLKIYLLTTGRD